MTVASSGFYGGNPETVLNSPFDMVYKAYQYELYKREYEETYNELNKEKS